MPTPSILTLTFQTCFWILPASTLDLAQTSQWKYVRSLQRPWYAVHSRQQLVHTKLFSMLWWWEWVYGKAAALLRLQKLCCQLSCPAVPRVELRAPAGILFLPAAEGREGIADSDPLPLLRPSYFFLWKLPPLQIWLQNGSCGHPLTYFWSTWARRSLYGLSRRVLLTQIDWSGLRGTLKASLQTDHERALIPGERQREVAGPTNLFYWHS